MIPIQYALLGFALPGFIIGTGLTLFYLKPKIDKLKETIDDLASKYVHTYGQLVAAKANSIAAELRTPGK